MISDNFKRAEFENKPQLNLSNTNNLLSGINAENKRTLQRIEEVGNSHRRTQKAIEQTAKNTGETNVQLQKVVENQNSYIDVLEEQLSTQKQHLELVEQQLTILKNIFESGEDGLAVEKEIMKLIYNQIDSSHPLWKYVKDKGVDIAVEGAIKGAPIIFNTFKEYLKLKGIL